MHTTLKGSRAATIPAQIRPKLIAAARVLRRFTVHQLQTQAGVGRSMALRFVATECVPDGCTHGHRKSSYTRVAAYQLRSGHSVQGSDTPKASPAARGADAPHTARPVDQAAQPADPRSPAPSGCKRSASTNKKAPGAATPEAQIVTN